MTAYGQQSRIALSLAVKVAREKRRKILEAVRHRRKLIYARFHQKMQAHKAGDAVLY